jgi:hypothetical protein
MRRNYLNCYNSDPVKIEFLPLKSTRYSQLSINSDSSSDSSSGKKRGGDNLRLQAMLMQNAMAGDGNVDQSALQDAYFAPGDGGMGGMNLEIIY